MWPVHAQCDYITGQFLQYISSGTDWTEDSPPPPGWRHDDDHCQFNHVHDKYLHCYLSASWKPPALTLWWSDVCENEESEGNNLEFQLTLSSFRAKSCIISSFSFGKLIHPKSETFFVLILLCLIMPTQSRSIWKISHDALLKYEIRILQIRDPITMQCILYGA